MKPFSNLEIEKITWEDISQSPESWASASEVEDWYEDAGEALVDHAGFVIFEDNHNLLIADSYIESLELFGNVHKIPKSVIRSRTRLSGSGDES